MKNYILLQVNSAEHDKSRSVIWPKRNILSMGGPEPLSIFFDNTFLNLF